MPANQSPPDETQLRLHRLFMISVTLKGLHAALECISGILLYVISSQAIISWVNAVTLTELVNDPHDPVANFLREQVATLTLGTQSFYALYLLGHGVLNGLMALALLRRQFWAYPASMAAFAGFIAYQLYRFSYTHGLGLIALTLLDIALMALIWNEWRRHRRLELTGAI